MSTPAFDESLYQRRVDELMRGGMDLELARDEAWLEQHPEGDMIVSSPPARAEEREPDRRSQPMPRPADDDLENPSLDELAARANYHHEQVEKVGAGDLMAAIVAVLDRYGATGFVEACVSEPIATRAAIAEIASEYCIEEADLSAGLVAFLDNAAGEEH